MALFVNVVAARSGGDEAIFVYCIKIVGITDVVMCNDGRS
jgi:hypothetical protein